MIRRLLIVSAVVALAACNGPIGPAGPAGADGPAGSTGPAGPGYDAPVSISAVAPRSLAVGLTADVTISGYATKWTDQSVVTFGAGITVRNVKAASSSAILATITVAPNAVPGPREVSVREGTVTSTFSGFEVLPYASLALSGTGIQGGLLRARILVNDPMFVFPANAVFSAGAGVSLVRVEKEQARSAEVLLGVDLDAAPGARTVSLGGAPGVNLSFPDALSVTANTPVDLPALPAMLTFSAPSESVVYNLTNVATGTVLEASEGALLGVLAPDAGWDTSSQVGNSLLLLNATGTVTVFDGAGDAGVTTVTGVPIPESPDTEPNDTELTAQSFAAIPALLTGSLLTGTVDDQDWFKVTVPASAVGKRVRMISTSAGVSYDFYVDVIQGGVSLGGDWNLYSYTGATRTALSDPIPAAGDLFIALSPYSDGDYSLTLVLE
ncbi:MAG: hypothetical protein Q8L48_43145 [Archangium sp.]|nr:hypothetical protein [Archangium sp.]